MKIGLIGYKGFLGQAFLHEWTHYGEIVCLGRNDDIGKLEGCKVIVNANGNSSKVVAESDPLFDFTSNALFPLKVSMFSKQNSSLLIHISSGEVENSIQNTINDKSLVELLAMKTNYGFSKTVGESVVQRYAENWMIIRPSGLIGQGMYKGPVYDLINGKPLWVNPESTLSLMGTETTARLTYQLMLGHLSKARENQTYNLMSKDPLSVLEIAARLNLKVEARPNLPIFHARIGSQQNIDPKLIPSTEEELFKYKRVIV